MDPGIVPWRGRLAENGPPVDMRCDLARTPFVTETKNSELMVAPSTLHKFLRAASAASKPKTNLSG
jgi:hypothetical protein